MQASDIIQVEHLQKSYGNVHAVQDISFNVACGQLFSFLGVNGAGKSTTVNILCSLLRKDGGTVRIAGYDLEEHPREIKPLLGVVFQGSLLDDLLTVRDNLTVRAACYGIRGRAWKERLAELESLLDLGEILDRPFARLSGGQRRRADIARGLVNRPQLLFLDEPTTGLDPQTRKSFWETIARLRAETGMTVFLTTHYMEEANVSDRVVIIDAGKIVADDTPAALKSRYSRNYLCLYGAAEGLQAAADSAHIVFERFGGGWRAVVSAAEARTFLAHNPDLCADFEFVKGDMDDVFLAVTGKQLHTGGEQ